MDDLSRRGLAPVSYEALVTTSARTVGADARAEASSRPHLRAVPAAAFRLPAPDVISARIGYSPYRAPVFKPMPAYELRISLQDAIWAAPGNFARSLFASLLSAGVQSVHGSSGSRK